MASANNINRRNQFQLQLLTQKINDNKNKLNQLTTARDNLINTSTSNNTNLEEQSTAQQNKLITLAEQKQLLENQNVEIRSFITKSRGDHSSITNQLKLLPSKLATDQKQEQDIYNEEIHSIECRIKEAGEQHLENLNQLVIDKSNLADDIIKYQNELSIMNDNITAIQENAHGFRKNTIQELQQRKQQKVTLQQMINNHNQQRDIYITTQNNTQDEIDKLTSLKSKAIDRFYSSNTNNLLSDLQTILANLNLEVPNKTFETTPGTTPGTTPSELLSTIVAYIDNKITTNKTILANINNKTEKLDKRLSVIYDTHYLNSNSSNDIKTRCHHPSYKQEFKTAKLEKEQLQKTIDTLIAKNTNWENEMITTARVNYQNILNELENDRQRAAERLEIMATRLTEQNITKLSDLQNQIKELEDNLADASNKLQNNKTEITKIEQEIQLANSTQIEINKLNTQITTLENTISKIQLDIDSLSNLV